MVKPLRRISENREKQIENVIVAARWQGTKIAPRVEKPANQHGLRR
ncbi:MAG: hypothetical protein ABSE20_01930 [Acetobacteraceae bacterium]